MILDKSILLWMSILIISCICFGWFGHIMYNDIMGVGEEVFEYLINNNQDLVKRLREEGGL